MPSPPIPVAVQFGLLMLTTPEDKPSGIWTPAIFILHQDGTYSVAVDANGNKYSPNSIWDFKIQSGKGCWLGDVA